MGLATHYPGECFICSSFILVLPPVFCLVLFILQVYYSTMNKILVTGGCGYIGAHTIIDLLENGYDVVSIDDNSRSSTYLLDGIEKITGKKIKNYKVDLKNFDETLAVFQENEDINGVIHFAAYK